MMNKKLLLALITLILGTSFSFGQTDSSAKKTIADVNAKIKSLKGFTANYSSSTTDKNKKVIATYKGTLTVKGTKFYVTMGNAEIISDGTKLWNYDGDKEVTVGKAADAADDWLSPQVFVDGIDSKDFNGKIISTVGNVQQLKLTPIDKRKNITSVVLTIDKTKNLITKVVLADKTGSTTTISFTNLNTNATIPDTKFVFDIKKHPGVEVIE